MSLGDCAPPDLLAAPSRYHRRRTKAEMEEAADPVRMAMRAFRGAFDPTWRPANAREKAEPPGIRWRVGCAARGWAKAWDGRECCARCHSGDNMSQWERKPTPPMCWVRAPSREGRPPSRSCAVVCCGPANDLPIARDLMAKALRAQRRKARTT